MPYVLGKTLSRIFYTYRFRFPNFRGKGRSFRWFRKLIREPRMIIPYGNGGWITVNDEGEFIERLIWYTGQHEPEVWKTLLSYVTQEDVLWDIGANIGSLAILGILEPHIKAVHCFEPHPRIVEILKLNLSLNSGQYYIHPIALSDEVGIFPFYFGLDGNSDISSLVAPSKNDLTETMIECVTIDHFLAEHDYPMPTLIKMDVEGAELKVLQGAKFLLKNTPPKAIIFEAECDAQGNILEQALVIWLQSFDYTIEHIDRFSGKMYESVRSNCYVENFVAVYNG